jgi:hypothetical protein
MQEERCPLCLILKSYDVETTAYCKYQNTERLVCGECASEIRNLSRPTWQIIAGRVFPKSLRGS